MPTVAKVAPKKSSTKPAEKSTGAVVIQKVKSPFFYGTGRRKNAIAKVWIFPGDGQISMNGHLMPDYVKRPTLVQQIVRPLLKTSKDQKYSVKISALGGGITGQAQAAVMGIARALLQLEPELKSVLRENGFLTRDPRMKERKKYGRKRARKGFQYRKR